MRLPRIIIYLIIVLICSFASAQDIADGEQIQKQRLETVMRDAKIRGAELKKEGFKESVGALSLDKQIEQEYMCQYEYKQFIIATQIVRGENYSAVKTEAINLIKFDIVNQIEIRVGQLVRNMASNTSVGSQEEEEKVIMVTVNRSKSMILQNLGRLIPIVEIYRTLPDGNIEIQMTMVYHIKNGLDVTKDIVGNALKEKSIKLADLFNAILN